MCSVCVCMHLCYCALYFMYVHCTVCLGIEFGRCVANCAMFLLMCRLCIYLYL